ncbi:MAG: AMP-binding protein [Pseudomonadota bacterium]|nr:AMP-binding protein [Pseudomonadota bacterium]
MGEPFAWVPTQDYIDNAELTRFARALGCADHLELERKSAADPDWFWDAAYRTLGIRFGRPYGRVRDMSAGRPWAKWCVGGTMNWTDNLLDRHRGTAVWDKPAVIWTSEDDRDRSLTYAELDAEVRKLAAGLVALGVQPGQAVGIYMPVLPETVVAFLAVARIGAIISPLFSGFGAEAIVKRMNDAEAVAVITVDAAVRRGQSIAMKPVIDQAAAEIPTLRHVVVLPDRGIGTAMQAGRDVLWSDLDTSAADGLPVEMVDADQALMIAYTSGTTGRPKGTVLTHCGFTIKGAMDFGVSFDLKTDDRLFWFADFGWVTGPFSMGGTLFRGATFILAEGTPDWPDTGRIWRLAARHRASFFGIAPTAVRSLMRHGTGPVAAQDLSAIRILASTGEPWTDEAWRWFFDHAGGGRCPVINVCGGTEISGGFICANVLTPQRPSSFAGPMPGMATDIVDADGNSVGPGQVGELVLRDVSPGLSRGIWGDPDRYIETYWSMFPDMWRHGDWASRDADGLWYVHGRSDDTIQVAGKRAGPAEIEGLVMATGKIAEAAAVAVPDAIKGEGVLIAAVPGPGATPGPELAAELSRAVVDGIGKAFQPKRVIFVDDLPKTRSLKIMRRVIRALVLDEPPGDLSALANPDAIAAVKRAARSPGSAPD